MEVLPTFTIIRDSVVFPSLQTSHYLVSVFLLSSFSCYYTTIATNDKKIHVLIINNVVRVISDLPPRAFFVNQMFFGILLEVENTSSKNLE